ncbi:MAG: helix-turn-helix domain-containing protein [Oscillospiraceae bacterium]|nr:helix-turn-helix domain-containing protein [Oscillospiraceae bacterium]
MKLHLGTNIKNLRAEFNLTQEQLAARLGCTAQAISKWETETTAPDIAMLPLLAQALGVRIDTLFEPGKTPYRHRGERLLAAYEADRSDEESYRAARAELEKRLPENDPEDHLSYAYLLELRGWEYLERAQAGYAQAAELGCEKATRQNMLLLHKLGQAEKPYFTTGDAAKAQGNFDEAFALWQQSYEQDRELVDALYSIACLHSELGNVAQARTAWQAVIDWLSERGYEAELAWPREMLAKLY